MQQGTRNSRNAFEDEEALDASAPPCDAALAGLPEAWHQYGWWFASACFSALWLADSWTFHGTVRGLAQGLLSLVIALVVCQAVYSSFRPHSARAAHALCVITATGLLLAHGLA